MGSGRVEELFDAVYGVDRGDESRGNRLWVVNGVFGAVRTCDRYSLVSVVNEYLVELVMRCEQVGGDGCPIY